MVTDTVLDIKEATTAIPKRRKLTLADVRRIADKVVKYRLNESEACYSLNINPKQWFNFKQKHKSQEQFNAMIETIRGSQIENCVQTIGEHGDGVEYTILDKQGQVVTLTKPGDWRAKAWIAERILAPERLGQQQQAAGPVQVNVYAQLGINVEKLIADGYARQKQLPAIDTSVVKQVEGSK